ncbi:MAG: hypothetical protein AAF797_16910, partial [Planctomycetota bacterium]
MSRRVSPFESGSGWVGLSGVEALVKGWCLGSAGGGGVPEGTRVYAVRGEATAGLFDAVGEAAPVLAARGIEVVEAVDEGTAVRRAAACAAGGGSAVAVIGVGFGRWGRRIGDRSAERALAGGLEALASAGLVGGGGLGRAWNAGRGGGRLVVVVGDGLMG